jgi:hypothetical protein
MGEKSLVWQNLELQDEIKALNFQLETRKEAYELLGYKLDMWRHSAEMLAEELKLIKKSVDPQERKSQMGDIKTEMELAEAAYTEYSRLAGGKSLATGQPLPPWSDLPDNILYAWHGAIYKVLCLVGDEKV